MAIYFDRHSMVLNVIACQIVVILRLYCDSHYLQCIPMSQRSSKSVLVFITFACNEFYLKTVKLLFSRTIVICDYSFPIWSAQIMNKNGNHIFHRLIYSARISQSAMRYIWLNLFITYVMYLAVKSVKNLHLTIVNGYYLFEHSRAAQIHRPVIHSHHQPVTSSYTNHEKQRNCPGVFICVQALQPSYLPVYNCYIRLRPNIELTATYCINILCAYTSSHRRWLRYFTFIVLSKKSIFCNSLLLSVKISASHISCV